ALEWDNRSVGLVEAPDVDPRAARVKLIGSHREEIAPIMAEGHVRWPRRGGELLQKRHPGGLLVYRKHRDGAGPGIGSENIFPVLGCLRPASAGLVRGHDGAYQGEAAVTAEQPGGQRAGTGGVIKVVRN